MKTFGDLNQMAAAIVVGFEQTNISDETVRQTLKFFSEAKYTCEQYTDQAFNYSDGTNVFNVRLLRDLCIAGLNYAGNTKMLKARFYSVWQQINAIDTD